MDTKNNLFIILKILKWVAIGLAILILILIILFCWSLFTYDFASYNPIIELGGGYTYNEDNYVIDGPDIDVPPKSEVIYNCDEYFVVKQKPEIFLDSESVWSYSNKWVYYYPYGKDMVYYWIIYKKEHRFVGPILKSKYKAILIHKDTCKYVGAFVRCDDKYRKDFIKRHGNDDFSIFRGTWLTMEEVRSGIAHINGAFPLCKSDTAYNYKDIYYCIQDSAVLRIEYGGSCIYSRTGKAQNNVEVDIKYINQLCKSFLNLDVCDIRMFSGGTIYITLNVNPTNPRLYRLKNDRVAEKEHCKKISGNWYAPNY